MTLPSPADPPPLAATGRLHDHAPSPPALTAVRLVCRECLPTRGGCLPHVARLLNAFLDEFSDTLTLARGYLLSDGSLRLLQYLAARGGPATDPILRRWAFNDVVGHAAAKGDVETLQWLLESYLPDEFLTKAVVAAASNGHLHVLERLWANYRSRSYWGSNELRGALRNKHSAVVAWLRDHTMPPRESAAKLTMDAVCCGDLTTVQWLIERFDVNTNRALGLAGRQDQCGVARWIIKNCELEAAPDEPYLQNFRWATDGGNVEFLKLVSSRNLWTPNAAAASTMMSSAAAAGHLEVVKWLHEELGFSSASDGYVRAAMGGHLEVLKYFHGKHLRNGSIRSLMDAAAKSGYIDVVQWLHANSQQNCTTNSMDGAAESGHLEVVQWLHEHCSEGCTSAAMHLAAVNGHVDVVKWLHAYRSEGCQEGTLRRVAECGNLELVQWLHDNRHEVFSCQGAMNIAATRGLLDVVKWLHENREEGCTVQAMDGAAKNGHLEVVTWLHENRNEGCTRRAMDGAAVNGHLGVVQWLHENRQEGCSVEAMDGAAERGNLEMVKWLHENRTEGCMTATVKHAALSNHLNVVKWLCRNRSEVFTSDAIEGAIRKGLLDIIVFLHTERPECRDLDMYYAVEISRIEIAEWLFKHFPREFEDCTVVVEPGDWHFGDWLQRVNQMQTD